MSQVVTKFPTSTTVIVSGWNNPTNAYAEDGNCTYSSTNNAEQKYGGWNFTTSDIPGGSTINKVEFGAKHYEAPPSGYIDYTTVKYVNSSGSSTSTQLTTRTTLTWDWWDITSLESSWDLTKLNNADCRIIMTEASGGGCFSEDTFFIRLAENGEKELVNVRDVKPGDMLYAYLLSDDVFDFVKVKEVRCSDAEEWITLYLAPFYKHSKTTGEMFAYQSHFTYTAVQPCPVWHEGVEDGKYVRFIAREVYERLRSGQALWMPYKTKLSKRTVRVPIQRAELHVRKAKAYNVILERRDAMPCLEEFHPNDIEFLERHGYPMKRFIDEIPVPMVTKVTVYVDAVALRVTFTPPAAAVPRNIGDSLASAVVNV